MSRKNCNAKRNWVKQYSFQEICRKLGINPRQRIVLRRYIIKKSKGGED